MAGGVDFNPMSAEFFADPYDTYRRLRDEAPVYYNERFGFYALSRFTDVLLAHRDWQAFSYRVVEDGLRRVQMANVAGFSHVPVEVLGAQAA